MGAAAAAGAAAGRACAMKAGEALLRDALVLAPALSPLPQQVSQHADRGEHQQPHKHLHAKSIAAGADPARRLYPRHARGPGGRRHPAQVRALRLLHRDLPDLPGAGRRPRQPARPHLPHEARARRRRGEREDAAPPRSLPHLPRLRDHLPLGRALRAPGRHRPRRGGGADPALALGSAETRRAFVRLAPHRAFHCRFAARAAGGNGAGDQAGRRVARPAPRAQDAGAARLRAAGARAVDQRGRGARARSRRHLAARGSRRWLLRRHPLPSQPPGGRTRRHARADRRLVADGRGTRGRGDRDDRERLRRHGEGLRAPARRPIRLIAARRSAFPR